MSATTKMLLEQIMHQRETLAMCCALLVFDRGLHTEDPQVKQLRDEWDIVSAERESLLCATEGVIV